MKQLRYLITAELDITVRAKQANGAVVETYSKIGSYIIQTQEIDDQVSASIYGADVNRMMRVSSPRYVLESFLASKMNVSADNVSIYSLIIKGRRYAVKAVREHWIDVVLM